MAMVAGGVMLLCRVLAAATLAAGCAGAHDLWIEPTTFFPQKGQAVATHLRVGVDLAGDAVLRDPALIDQFIAVDAGGRWPVAGLAGDDPAGMVRTAAPGLTVVGYSSHPSAVELPAAKFNQYLKEEGLDAVIAERARRNESGTNVRENFSRSAKSLLLSGPPGEAQRDQPLGFTLELVAERNPYALRVGQSLPVRLIYQNRPLAGALVVAMNSLDPARKQAMRTDAEGRVRFSVRPGGLWLIKAVHMVRAPVMSNAAWRSYWASLTFGMGNPRAAKVVAGQP